MKVYLNSDFASTKVIVAKKIVYDLAKHCFVVYGRDGHITFVDLANTHFINVCEDYIL